MNFQQQSGKVVAEEYYTLKSYLNKLSQSAQMGIWEFNTVQDPTISEWTSVNVFELLGYIEYKAQFNFNYFLTQLVHQEDQFIACKFFEDSVKNQQYSSIEIRLLTHSQGYRWFSITGNAWWGPDGELKQILGTVLNIDLRKRASITSAHNEQLLLSTTQLLEAGGWEADLITGNVSLTAFIYALLEIPPYFKVNTENIKKFYHPQFSSKIHEAFKSAIENRTISDAEVCLITAKGNAVWVQVKGYALYDNNGKCTSLKGSLQKLNKSFEIELLNTNKHLTEQNKRLQNFAHIVSHNLRSYSNNLQAILQLIHRPNLSPKDQEEHLLYIQHISTGLANTVNHLSEMVRQQDDVNKRKAEISFQETLDKITSALQNELNSIHAEIITEFDVPTVNYLPAYMDSILLNLITNAVKYRHPDRNLRIHLKSYEHEGHIYLSVEDNGLGIDMKKHGDSIFGMYKTFHRHPDSRGLGLFMTRNQVETLGGSIEVSSELNIGTIFTIKLV